MVLETKFVKVEHGSESHFLALYTGVSPVELSNMMKAVYKLSNDVVGLQSAETGLVVPLSLACRDPELASHGKFIIVEGALPSGAWDSVKSLLPHMLTVIP